MASRFIRPSALNGPTGSCSMDFARTSWFDRARQARSLIARRAIRTDAEAIWDAQV
jgi:hypothetical protein